VGHGGGWCDGDRGGQRQRDQVGAVHVEPPGAESVLGR
jgi:hypothetical protein